MRPKNPKLRSQKKWHQWIQLSHVRDACECRVYVCGIVVVCVIRTCVCVRVKGYKREWFAGVLVCAHDTWMSPGRERDLFRNNFIGKLSWWYYAGTSPPSPTTLPHHPIHPLPQLTPTQTPPPTNHLINVTHSRLRQLAYLLLFFTLIIPLYLST